MVFLQMSRHGSTRLLLFIALGFIALSVVLASTPSRVLHAEPAASAAIPPAIPPLAESDTRDEPGLMMTIKPAAGGPTHLVFEKKHISRMLASYVPLSSQPNAATPLMLEKTIFEGDINLRLRDFFIFSAEGRGKLTLTINGKLALDQNGEFGRKPSEPIRLNKGKNHIVADYIQFWDKGAELRVFWATKTTSAEPIPPMVFTHSSGDKGLRENLRVREGEWLIVELRCARCHDFSNTGAGRTKPDMAEDGPSLSDAGDRLNVDWMAAWINNPNALWSGAHMPRMFASKNSNEIAPQATDIAAYLATLGSNNLVSPTPDLANKDAGGRFFSNLNCVACHISPERNDSPQQAAEAGRVPLAFVKEKYKPQALKQYLFSPSTHFASTPMPDFRLSNDEADELAAYLLLAAAKQVSHTGRGDARRGEKLFNSSGCTNCHGLPVRDVNVSDSSRMTVVMDWSAGCLASDVTSQKSAPTFCLTEDQRVAIRAFAAAGFPKSESPADLAERQIVALRCTACHSRDGHESLLATDLDAENQELHNKYPNAQQASGEGFAPDQRAPILTWAGEKLRPEWMRQFIEGKISYKPRYYLRARMPGFGVHAQLLAEGLTAEHGYPTHSPAHAQSKKELANVGQSLVGKTPNQSFGCVQCHAINQQAPLAPFEAPAINFMHVTERLREDYYYRWIHDPLRVDPETKMPRFDDADGKTGITTVFDGDARKQYEAIWNYLLRGEDIQPPAE